MITRRRGVHEMAPVMFMKPLIGGGDESQTRPPPQGNTQMPASGPAFCLGGDRVLVISRGGARCRLCLPHIDHSRANATTTPLGSTDDCGGA
jgi:hypothetical protein